MVHLRFSKSAGHWREVTGSNLTFNDTMNDFFFSINAVTGSSAESNRRALCIGTGVWLRHGWNFTTISSVTNLIITPRLNSSDINGIITALAGVPATYISEINVAYEQGDLMSCTYAGNSAGTTQINRGRSWVGREIA